MPIEHRFESLIADVGGPTYVQPTHWNDNHIYPPLLAHAQSAGTRMNWVDMPSAITDFRGVPGAYEFAYDFTNVSHVRVVSGRATQIAFASAALGVQWQELNNNGSWWGIASGGTSAAWCGLGSGAIATGLAVKVGTWYPVNPSARAAGFVQCKFVGFMGDGVVDPYFGALQLFVL